MANKKKENSLNFKFDAETKKDIDALAFIKGCSRQQLCEDMIKEGLKPYADKIAEARKLRE